MNKIISCFEKPIIGGCVAFLMVNILGFFLLALSYCIPTDFVRDSISEACDIYMEEGMYATGDGYTDMLILSTALVSAEKYDKSIFRMAISNYVCAEALRNWNPLDGLYEVVHQNGEDYDSYSNYFVGIVGVIKILLTFVSLNTLRWGMFATVLILFALCIYRLSKDFSVYMILPFATLFLLGNFCEYARCITYAIDIIIMLASTLLTIAMCERNRHFETFIGTLAGSITFFLNYWSFPIYSLCVPLVVFVLLLNVKKVTNRELVIRTLKYLLAWCLGFGMELLLRISSSYIFCGGGTIATHLGAYTGEFFYHTEYTDLPRGVKLWNVICSFFDFRTGGFVIMLILFSAFLLVFGLLKSNKEEKKNLLIRISILFFVSLIPIVWLTLLINHTVHGFDKYLLSMSVFALQAMPLVALKRKNGSAV